MVRPSLTLNSQRLYPWLQSGLWLLMAWLSAEVIADIAQLVTGAPPPVTTISTHIGPEQTPPVALDFWSEAPQPTRQLQPLTQLPITLQGIVRAPQLNQSLVVLTTPQGQINAMTGDTLMPQVTLDRISPQGLILNHRGQQERLPWPEAMPPTELSP